MSVEDLNTDKPTINEYVKPADFYYHKGLTNHHGMTETREETLFNANELASDIRSYAVATDKPTIHALGEYLKQEFQLDEDGIPVTDSNGSSGLTWPQAYQVASRLIWEVEGFSRDTTTLYVLGKAYGIDSLTPRDKARKLVRALTNHFRHPFDRIFREVIESSGEFLELAPGTLKDIDIVIP